MRFDVAAIGSGLAMLSLAACGTPPTQAPPRVGVPAEIVNEPVPEQPEQVKVGMLLPLSGNAAALGEDMLQAAEMALFDAGESRVILVPRDTSGTADGARTAALQLVDEGIELFIGPLYSAAVEAVAPIAEQADIRVLSFSNVARVAGDGTFILGFRPEEQVRRVVAHALDQGLTRFAGLAPDDAYGETAMRSLQRAVIEGGGELTETLFYPADLSDPSPVVQDVANYRERQEKLEKERQLLQQQGDESAKLALERLELVDTLGEPPFDAILLADGGDRLRSVASLLTFYDVDPGQTKFLGTIRWQDDPRTLNEEALRGGWFAASSPSSFDAFSDRFESEFGSPPEQLAGLAYDATALAVIVERDLKDRRFDPFTLTDPEGFAGAAGLFRLRGDGLVDHGLAVLEVIDGGIREVDPAPNRFVDDLAQQRPAVPQGALDRGGPERSDRIQRGRSATEQRQAPITPR